MADTYTSFDVAVAYDCGYRSGEEHERKQIVTWLREEARLRMVAKHESDSHSFNHFTYATEQRELENQADMIENREHLK